VQAVILVLTILNYPKYYFRKKRKKEGYKVSNNTLNRQNPIFKD